MGTWHRKFRQPGRAGALSRDFCCREFHADSKRDARDQAIVFERASGMKHRGRLKRHGCPGADRDCPDPPGLS